MLKLSHNLGWLKDFRTFPAKYGLDFERTIETLSQKGLSAVEFFPVILEFSPNLKRIRHIIEKNNLYFYSGHLPMMGGVLSDNKDRQEYLWKYMQEWLEFFAELGIQTAVVHPDDAYYQETEIPKKLDCLVKYAEFLGKTAEKYNMKIALETLWEKGQLFTKIEELDYFQKNIPSPNIGFCFDTGHVFGTSDNRCWKEPQTHLEETFKLIKNNIVNFHIRDTDVNSDKHLPLGEGSINFKRFFALLQELNPAFPITIEIEPRLESETVNCLNIDRALDKLYQPFKDFLNSRLI